MLVLRDLSKRFGDRVAVDGLSLDVGPGEVVGLLGPNGAGKTTTIHMAVGLLAPDRGEVRIGDRGSPRRPEARRLLGVAPQALALYDALTPAENLAFFGRVQGLSGPALSRRVDWALDFAALSDRRRDRTGDLSGGMKRRLNLAAALVHDPEVVLLDEPTVGVDPQSRNAILERVAALRAAGRAVVYTTHYMDEAARVCDRVAIVDHGTVLASGTVAELVAAHGGEPTLVVVREGVERRLATPDPAAALARILADGRVDDFRVERADLEAVFLSLTGRRLRDP
ncbi:MAG TPA: ABC transporter ATP-binding protein [Anaeromyxobacteraceae bacterium]|nr:ABC transporter ATP-binding protein [Anaeromyxobacteraceae bacterium]